MKTKVLNNLNFLTIVLDEPDNTFHPRWQRELLSELISFLQTGLFEKDKTIDIQIIFTTNNPMMLSDLPKNNIVFLKKNNNKMEVIPSKDMEETFAANLNTLYSNSFFLGSDSLSEFARSKINNLFEIINGDHDYIKENEILIRKEIDIIGEPIIKQALLNLLQTNLKPQYNEMDIEELEAILKEKKRYNKEVSDDKD